LDGKKIACYRYAQGRREYQADFEKYLCRGRSRLWRIVVPCDLASKVGGVLRREIRHRVLPRRRTLSVRCLKKPCEVCAAGIKAA
jgi:hypothetical protein